MRTIKYTSILLLLAILNGCCPAFDLLLENKTREKIQVIYYPILTQEQLYNKSSEKITWHGHDAYKIIIEPAETIEIGTVYNNNTPTARFIDLDYLLVAYGKDTIQLVGKNAILSSLQKIETHDWRLLIQTDN